MQPYMNISLWELSSETLCDACYYEYMSYIQSFINGIF